MARPNGSIIGLKSDETGPDSTDCSILALVEHRERRNADIHQHLASVLEIDRDPVAHDRLNLPDPPIGLARMADTLTGFVFGSRPHGSGERAPRPHRPEALDPAVADSDIPVESVHGRVAMAGHQPQLLAKLRPGALGRPFELSMLVGRAD